MALDSIRHRLCALKRWRSIHLFKKVNTYATMTMPSTTTFIVSREQLYPLGSSIRHTSVLDLSELYPRL